MKSTFARSFFGLLLATACSSDSGTETSISTGPITTHGGESDTGEDSSGTTGGERLDIGGSSESGATAEGGDPEGCTKVDVLFVIDNSGSMAGEQAALVASFPGFVTGMQQQLEAADSYHVGVVTTDDYANNEPGCTSIGNLVTQTGGDDSSMAVCSPFSSGARYLDDTEPDLTDKFSCVGRVGTVGDGDERAIQALLRSLAIDQNGPGGCNEGFIRDDALLVIVIISDEDDQLEECVPLIGCLPADGSPGSPPEWFQNILSLKHNIPDNIVVLSVVGQENNSCGAEIATRIIQFTNNFVNSSIGDICAQSYDGFFTDAISIVDGACDDFVPPG